MGSDPLLNDMFILEGSKLVASLCSHFLQPFRNSGPLLEPYNVYNVDSVMQMHIHSYFIIAEALCFFLVPLR